jgi:protein TonB
MRVKGSNSQIPESKQATAAGFSRCLIETDAAEKGRSGKTRGEALAASAVLQVCAVILLVIAPLFATSTRIIRQRYEIIPPYGGSSRPNQTAAAQRPQPTEIQHRPTQLNFTQISAPNRIPSTVSESDGEKSVTDALSTTNSIGNGGSGDTAGTGLIGIFDDRTGPIPPQPAATAAPAPRAPISISEGVVLGKLTHRVEPTYPIIARQTRTEGTVQLRAIISKDGAVEHLEVISGSPLLVRAATDAVLQWRFRSTLLNGEPVEVQTYFTVVFHLGQ